MHLAPRSWLFIPGDSEKKLAKAEYVGADAVILDLEDAVSAANKPRARELAATWLREPRGRTQRWVRVNPLDSGMIDDDLSALVAGAPAGIVLPKAEGPGDVRRLAERLDALGVGQGVAIHAIVTETARAVLRLTEFAGPPPPRLSAMSWGAEDLSADVGASGNRHADGQFHALFGLARSLTLAAAASVGVSAVETLHADFKDERGLDLAARRARAEGFTGMLAIHPAQVAVINAAFMPSDEELAHARAIVAAFDDAGTGTVAIDGKMIDRPHWVQATRLLARAQSLSE